MFEYNNAVGQKALLKKIIEKIMKHVSKCSQRVTGNKPLMQFK